ncbi:translocation/assembly module TamB domain-containing protein [Gallaecimonas sp. GXIMD4217]|uniref:autotransporter assembly complex protein TamB n=1 Tax=Gallaecimonas sp. GXIMD4217 TaxID=3131927 RepID=UPI00311B261B
MKALKWLLITLASLVLVLGALLWGLLLTEGGNRLLWRQAQQVLPQLSGELVSGSLGQGWRLSGLGWQDDGFSLEVDQLRLAWSPWALLRGELPVQALDMQNVRIRLANQAGTEPGEAKGPGRLSLPIRLELEKVRVEDLRLESEAVNLALDSLSLSGHWYRDRLALKGPEIQGLVITTRAGDSPPEADGEQPPTLPALAFPLAVQVRELTLKDGRWRQGEQYQALEHLALDARAEGHRLTVERLVLSQQLAEASLSGQVALRDGYPLELQLALSPTAALLDGQLKGQTLALTASGELAALDARLVLDGPLPAQARLQANLLGSELPFSLELDWQPFTLALPGQGELALAAGRLQAQGSLAQYQLRLNGELASSPWLSQPLGLALAARGDLAGLTIDSLGANTAKGSLVATGRLDWQQGLDWQGQLRLEKLDPALLTPQFSGAVSGTIDGTFSLQGTAWRLAAEPVLQGELLGYPLAAKGALSLNDKMQGRVEQLLLRQGPNRLSLDGVLAEQWRLQGRLEAPNLSALGPGFYGSLLGRLELSGPAAEPVLALALEGDVLGHDELELRGLKLEGRQALLGKLGGDWRLRLAEVAHPAFSARELRLEAEGDRTSQRLSLAFAGEPLAAELALSGRLDGGHWQGRFDTLTLDTPLSRWQPDRQVELDWRQAGRRLGINNHCWRSKGAALCLDETRLGAETGQGGFQIRDLDLARLAPFLPEGFGWQAVLAGQGRFAWQGGEPELALALTTSPGQIHSGELVADYRSLSLRAGIDNQQLDVELAFASAQLGRLELQARVGELDGDRSLAGRFRLDELTLDWLAPLLPELRRLSGRIQGQGRLDGTLKAPLLYGELALGDGRVETALDVVTLSELHSTLTITGDRASLSGETQVGEGRLGLDGELDWRQWPMTGQLRLRGENLAAGYPGLGRLRISPDLHVTLGEVLAVSGDLHIPWARMLVEALPESAAGLSPDVVIVDGGEPRRQDKGLPLRLAVTTHLGDDVRLEAFGLKTALTGSLTVRQRPGKAMVGEGEVRLNNGTFKAYGQNLVIRRGSILFTGPLAHPDLEVEAIRNPKAMADSNIVVGVRVSGSAQKPEVAIFSEPAMEQALQLSYLLRGKGLEDEDESDSNVLMQSLLVSAGISQLGGVVSQLAEGLGMQDVMLDTSGAGDQTQVNISGYLLPGLQLEYGVGVFSSVGELRLRYELLPRLYLQAVNGVDQAVDLFYRFEF